MEQVKVGKDTPIVMNKERNDSLSNVLLLSRIQVKKSPDLWGENKYKNAHILGQKMNACMPEQVFFFFWESAKRGENIFCVLRKISFPPFSSAPCCHVAKIVLGDHLSIWSGIFPNRWHWKR